MAFYPGELWRGWSWHDLGRMERDFMSWGGVIAGNASNPDKFWEWWTSMSGSFDRNETNGSNLDLPEVPKSNMEIQSGGWLWELRFCER